MEFNRNRYFLLGLLLILLGFQFRMVDSFVLNEPATRALARVTKDTPVASNDLMTNFAMRMHPSPKKHVAPPRWLGLAMITLGVVVSLHSLAIPKR